MTFGGSSSSPTPTTDGALVLALGRAMGNHAVFMRRPGLCSKALIAALVAGLSSAPVSARPLILPEQLVTASSGPRLALVVVPLDGPSKATRGVLELAGEASARSAARFEVVAAVDAFDPKIAADRLAKVETARTKMVDGQKALDDLDTAKGATDFGEAVRLLKETDTSRAFDELVKAWVMKAASHAMGGEVPPAKQEIERIVAVQPKAEFNSQFFPPDLLKFVEQQRKLANAAKGELTLRTEPPGANVWVNGKLVGRSPLSVKGLLGSRHQVVAALGGTTLTLAELPPGDAMLELKPAELAPVLTKTIDTITKSPKTAARDQALVALGKKLQVDQVLAVLVKKSTAGEQFELTALRIEVRDGHNAAYGTATQPLAEPTDALKTFFDTLVATDAPRQGKTPVTHFDGDAGGGGSGKKIVGIALLGVAAGLVAAGIGTGVVGQQRYEQFRATPQVQSGISQGYANEARALGGVSLGSFIGAGVAAGVGTFLLVSSGTSGDAGDPEPEPKKATKKKTEIRRDDGKKPDPKKEEPKKTEPVKEEPPPAKVDPKEEKRRKDEEAKKAKEDEARLKKEEEQRAKDDAEAKKKADADAKKAKEEEARRAEEEKKKADADAKKAKEEEARRAEEEKKAEADAKKGKKVDPKKKAEEEAAAAKAAEEEKKEEEERKKKEDEDKKRREEEEKKKAEQKKKEEDHDDLRNY